MKRKMSGFLFILTFFLFVSPAFSTTFNFNTNNQGWRSVGLYDNGGLNQIPGHFSDDPAPWSSVSGSGAILVGSGGFTMPPSPTGDQFLHWDLNSPVLSSDSQWQGITALKYDVTGKYIHSFQKIYVQAVLIVIKPGGSTGYFTDAMYHEIPLEASGGWATHTVDVTSLGMPAGTVIQKINLRFFFDAGSGHDGFIMLDNVTPISGSGGNPGDSCGAGKVLDCELNCVDSATAQSYIGDGYCDDGTWGYVLTCPAFNNDGGDCGGGGNPGDSCGSNSRRLLFE